MRALSCYTCTLTDRQTAELEALLRDSGFAFRKVNYARFAGEKPDVNVVMYNSGKLVVQGKGTREFVEFVLEPQVLREARLGYERVLSPELFVPRLGIDESGKGDLFGPLCVAGVYVNEEVIRAWQDAGIRDSKRIASDARIGELAELIRSTRGCVTAVVPIGNKAYNRLHAKMQNVNALLAWGHARVIENLMSQQHRMNPPPVKAISDQFARDKDVVAKALMPMGRRIELTQTYRAEEDLAVAAASILARHEFITRLKKLEGQYGMLLPRGASLVVEDAAKKFIARHGPENFARVAKLHFRTALRALGVTDHAGGNPPGTVRP